MTYHDLVTALMTALEQHNPALAAEIKDGYDSTYRWLEASMGDYPNESGMEAVYWLVDQLLNGLPPGAAINVRLPVTV